jgi:hypothetical protein
MTGETRHSPSETALAWIAFADTGHIRFWTADAARAEAERKRGMDLRGFTLAEIVALSSRTAPYPQSARDNLGRRIDPAPMPEALKDTVATCYGLLWLVKTDDKGIHRARRGLLQWLTSDEQGRGIQNAKAILSMAELPEQLNTIQRSEGE